MEPGWMEMLKRKLMGGGQPEPQAPMPPMQGKPWEQPMMGGQPMHQMPGGQMMPGAQHPDMAAVGAMPGQPMSPMDDALMMALKKKRFNQQVAGATGNPIPR